MLLVILFFAGVILWTFLEYVLHRYLGHWKEGKNPFTVEHLRHHREVHYFAPFHKKFIAAVAINAILTFGIGLPFGWLNGAAFALGLTSMYLIYELIHKRAHTHCPLNKYGEWQRKHHFHHHFKDPKSNHGVTSPIWDWVFGTAVIPDVVRVPKKFMILWLTNESTGEVFPKYASDYIIK